LRDDAPAGVDQASWNGKPVAVHRNADGNLTAGDTSRYDGIGFTWPSAAAGERAGHGCRHRREHRAVQPHAGRFLVRTRRKRSHAVREQPER
jgi:hypothetical protein